MDRNNMSHSFAWTKGYVNISSYLNSGPRSLPHMGKRHNGNGHNARLSPPAPPHHNHSNHSNNHPSNHGNHVSQHDDIINYIYDSWNKVTRDLERGGDDAKYYQEMPRQLANFRPFNLEELWARRIVQSVNRNKHRS